MLMFWTLALGLTILLYVTLDGFDLGIGMLLVLARDETAKRHMLASIAPVWDGNETWLVLNASILFGIFPLAYATLLSAFYLPLVVMLAGLILRGVSFEFRAKSIARRWVWDGAIIAGSTIATFIQGTTVGALVEGLPIVQGVYVGGPFGWFSPFALLCGAGLCLGYMLLGAGWLTYRTTEDVRTLAFRILPWLLAAVLLFLVFSFASAALLHFQILNRWLERPVLLIFPLMGACACAVMAWSIAKRRELVAFLCGLVIFAAAFFTLALSFYPFMIPFSVTIDSAAAPYASQAFLFWGAGLFVLPLTLIYTGVVYFIFKGKVSSADHGHY